MNRWCRPLLDGESAFVQTHFGTSLQGLDGRLRLHLRRLGDTRRALSLPGGHVFMPRACFEGAQLQGPLRLHHPVVAGLFAHELLHQWQRLQGRAVTREAAWLQVKAVCLRRDPYAYTPCGDAAAMLQAFQTAQVEQQGQMWEDHVRACVAGEPLSVFKNVAAWVRDPAR